MKFDAKIKYEESYLPTKRHRIPRIREVDETVSVTLREVKKEDAPLAMVVTDYQSYLDQNGEEHFGLRDTSFFAIAGQLYSEKRDMWGSLDKGVYSLQAFMEAANRNGDCRYAWDANRKSREDMLQSLEDFLNAHVMIDGIIYEEKNEPRYVVQTFGLGHNHGGTGMFVTTHYNSNISQNNYFNALQFDEAVAYADKVAAARGDTNDIGKFGKNINIKVYMPEMVRCNPQMEHGDGDPFLNGLESLVQASDSSLEAGLLVMASTISGTNNKKLSINQQIDSASSRAVEPSSQPKGKEPEPEI